MHIRARASRISPISADPASPEEHSSLLRVGATCASRQFAREAAVLIDGDAYFRALRSALLAAREHIYLVGWEAHSGLLLLRDQPDDGYPVELAELLDVLARERPELAIHVLIWNAGLMYHFDRDSQLRKRLGDATAEHVHLVEDSAHPPGGSQHMKIAVIDDEIAFCGGLDAAHGRWDTREHALDDERRVDPAGDAYPPFHDVQLMLRGDAAAALGNLARDRWLWATGERLPTERRARSGDRQLSVDAAATFRDVPVAIARTLPAHQEHPEVHEIERLYLDAIASARETIYLENQFFCADTVIRALARRLREPDGPEVVVVTTHQNPSALESNTMDRLRDHAIEALREADTHGRFAAYSPWNGDQLIKVHSKAATFDDRLLRIGSANLSNRSMGLDSECDVAIEAQDDRADVRREIARVRHQLLSEHLGTDPASFERALHARGSLIGAIESLRGGRRDLRPLPRPREPLPPTNELGLFDVQRPYTDELVDTVGVADPESPRLRMRLLLGFLFVLIGAAIAFHQLVDDPDALVPPLRRWLADLGTGPFELPLAVGAFALLATVAVPVTLLVLISAVALPPWQALTVSLLGSLLAASLGYGLGAALGQQRLRRSLVKRMPAVGRALRKRGAIAVAGLRIVPAAPFAVVNVLTGAVRIGFGRYLIGTLVGMAPGLAAFTLFGDRLFHVAADCTAGSVTIVIATALAALLVVRGLEWLIERRQRRQAQ